MLAEQLELGREQRELQGLVPDADADEHAAAVGELLDRGRELRVDAIE